MAYNRTPFVSVLLISFYLSGSLFGQKPPKADDKLIDPVLSDTTAIDDTSKVTDKDTLSFEVDSLLVGEPDSIAGKKVAVIPETHLQPYYRTYILGKSYGDYLNYMAGVVSLQHGAFGQPELLVKSVLLGGLDAVYNGVPVFHQGFYFPFRRGIDLNVLMFENVSEIDITPLSYLDLYSQGQVLSLRAMAWPAIENPSSISVARQPYGYSRSAWRFSRWFSRNAAATFTAGFKESRGYYQSGTDYDGFDVAGSFALLPRPNSEIIYTFFQGKAKKEILQFDRVIVPSLRVNSVLNHHSLNGKYKASERSQFELNLFHQKNYGHLFDDTNYHHRLRDFIWGGKAVVSFGCSKHNFTTEAGGQRHYVGGLESGEARSVTMGIVVSDSVAISQKQDLVVSARTRHNNINGFSFAGSGRYLHRLNSQLCINISAGHLDCLPDIYSMYFNHPTIDMGETSLYDSYNFQSNSGLEYRKTVFATSGLDIDFEGKLSLFLNLAYEKVNNDILFITEGSSGIWFTTPVNVDYNRVTFTMNLDYFVTKYFKGSSGVTYFVYDPDSPLPGVKHSPNGLAFSSGELKFEGVLRDLDISGAYQIRYISSREYYGFILELYEPAVVLDGAIIVRFGSFEFRLIEDNILDYIVGNRYNIWGEYIMPPGSVWWQFTWNFEN